ncbi:L-rhamnose mutarotase [soil metagenome]
MSPKFPPGGFRGLFIMQRVAFKMKLFKGFEEEYKRRHTALWPELQVLLQQAGIKDYSIFLDETTNDLFGYLTLEDATKLDALPSEPVMKKWWAYMADIMDTNEDKSPVSIPLKEVFYLP